MPVNEVFTEFKKAYPNHGAPFSPSLIPWYRAALGRSREIGTPTRRLVDPTLKLAYEQWISGRGVNTDKPNKTLKAKIKIIREHFPHTTHIWVQGSRVIGDWVDKKTAEDEIKLRMFVGKDKKLSDWDFFIYPVQAMTIGDIHLMGHQTSEAKLVYGDIRLYQPPQTNAQGCDSCLQK